jgi:hypothetical protein
MISPPGGSRVLVATAPVDFRKGAEGLAALVKDQMKLEPFSGVLFVFRAKRADQATFNIRFALRQDRLWKCSSQPRSEKWCTAIVGLTFLHSPDWDADTWGVRRRCGLRPRRRRQRQAQFLQSS